MKNCPSCRASYPNNFAVCPQDGTALVELTAWPEGTVVRGKYRILSKLGQGGMGVVYKAVHLAFEELRALKVINVELMPDELFVKRFKHEAVITRRLQHPNAVRVDDIDEAEDGRPFIVMEYIEGESLKKLIKDSGPLPVPRVCAIIKQSAAALDAAHRLGMVHRDIKPENIVLVPLATPPGSTGLCEQAKVLDFGIAKVKEGRLGDSAGMTLTGTGVVIGTPQYMSPEQAKGMRGDELDGRSDLYSLGIVMYQMLSGELPFKADTSMEMLLAHMARPPAPIGTIRPGLQIPDAIARVVMKTLEKNREARPANAQALIDEINQAEKAMAPASEILPETIRIDPQPSIPRAPAPPLRDTRPPATPEPRPAARAAQPAPPRPAPVAKHAPKARESHWGLWVGLVILVAGLGGGVWYYRFRRPPEPPPIQVVPQPKRTEPKSAPSSNPPVTTAGDTGQSSAGSGATAKAPETEPAASNPTPAASDSAKGGSERKAIRQKPMKSPVRGVQPAVLSDADRKKVSAAVALGDFNFKRGQYDAAIQQYQAGLGVDPNNQTLKDKIDQAKKAKAAEQRLSQ